jgi:hypothetical protein
MTNSKNGKYANFPTEESLRWDYFVAGDPWPSLERGQRVLVDVWGRRRVAVCQQKIPGGLRWAQICAPCSGNKRVVVSKNSLIAVEKHANKDCSF